MKILHIIYSFGIYGAEKHLLNLLPELKKNNFDCELICVCPPKSEKVFNEYARKLNDKGIKAVILISRNKASVMNTAYKISQYLKANEIKIIHTHLFRADLVGVVVKKAFFKDLIILSTKHGYEEKYLVRYGLGNKKIPGNFYYFLSRQIYKGINHHLAVSDAIAEMYYHLKLSKTKIKFIHHGINQLTENPKMALMEGGPKILIAGRLEEMKGHKYLIGALPTIVKHFPELKLYILGEGSLRNELTEIARMAHVQENIEFKGFVSPEKYFSQCQVIVLPSIFEPFGLVYIEAFASKIPVVAFDAQAANEIIDNNETGILVEKGNSEALAEKIIYLMNNPEERKRITEKAYKKFQDYYNVERMAKETAEWYRSVLGSGEV